MKANLHTDEMNGLSVKTLARDALGIVLLKEKMGKAAHWGMLEDLGAVPHCRT